MKNKTEKFELEIGGKKIIAEIKNLAEQASGSVFLRCGDTVVLTTAVVSEKETEIFEFFPLTVEYEERFYAAGKIRGPRYIKRETRPSDEAICNARLIDRAIRPLFPEDFEREVQVVTTVLSWDGENDPDILGLLGASLALLISDIPWEGPIGVLRVGLIDEKFVLNPTYEQKQKSKMDLIISAVERKGELLINMLEGEFEEIEEEFLKAFEFVKPELKKIADFQREIQKVCGKEKKKFETKTLDEQLRKELLELFEKKLEIIIYRGEKTERKEELLALKEEIVNFVQKRKPEEVKLALKFLKKEIDRIVHKNIIEKEKRPDGRKLDELREISCEVGVLPRTHGSGLFCRGQTKSLSILTLGAPGDVQLLEGMEIVGKKRFMHHYNFPPYSTGEVKPIKGPGRREIGHGVLVEKALLPVIPSFEEFPYTIRIVSEILSSNGSTSMAAVCSSSLALMDAGVPIKRAVAGIALGLMQNEKGEYKILTDIQGPEDQNGDMDLKLAGTKKGLTACQMDVKIAGISEKILRECLEKSKKARMEIFDKMESVIKEPRPMLSLFAPRVLTLKINPEKIREVIGPGGRTINEIIGECGVSIDIEETGKIFVTAEKEEAAKKAIAWIKNITREVKVGEVFQGKVKRILNFGAIIEILPGQEGLLHISQFKRYKVIKIEDFLKIGEILPVKVISIDKQGRINLALKDLKIKKFIHR